MTANKSCKGVEYVREEARDNGRDEDEGLQECRNWEESEDCEDR